MIKTLLLALLLCVVSVFPFHKLCLWLEDKGWIYYRHKKPQSGIIGNTLQELNAILQPSTRHTIEMKQNEARFKRHSSDVPSEPEK